MNANFLWQLEWRSELKRLRDLLQFAGIKRKRIEQIKARIEELERLIRQEQKA